MSLPLTPRVSAWPQAFVLCLVASLLAGLGCSNEQSMPGAYNGSAGTSGTTSVERQPCADGSQRKCGVTLARHNGVASCFKGTQTCSRGSWGPCSDGQLSEEVLSARDGSTRRAASLSAPDSCTNNPCDPYCQSFTEVPPAPIMADVSVPSYPWQNGTIGDLSDATRKRGANEPCQTGADCQFNRQCTNVATGGACVHSKCEPGAPLAADCDPCVQAVCGADPSCCAASQCTHDVCTAGVKLDPSCDGCAQTVCATKPECCTDNWDSSCVALAASTCGASTCACGPGEVLGPTGTCYFVYSLNDNWYTARNRCQAHGAGWDLASITSETESNFILSLISQDTATWVGLNDQAQEGSFVWANGEPFSYSNWSFNQPDNFNPAGENCVEVFGTWGLWNDANCDVTRDELCEGPAQRAAPQWSASCVDKVKSLCNATCGAGSPPAASGECAPWLPGATNASCSNQPDLAVGVPCAGAQVPVCNHGTAAAPAGVTLAFFPAGSSPYPACAPSTTSARGTCATTSEIAPGACVTVTCEGLQQGDEIVVNPAGTSHIGECACQDDWSIYDGTVSCTAPVCSELVNKELFNQLNLFISVDKSGSMGDADKWAGTTTGLGTFFGDTRSAGTSVALQFFPLAANGTNPGCGEASCDPSACATPNVPLGALQASSAPTDVQEAALLAAIAAQTPGGMRPSAPALQGALDWAAARGAPGKANAVVFITDGEPTSCLTGDSAQTNQTLALAAQTAFTEHDVRTYVIGLPGSNSTALNSIAAKGGTNQAFLIDATAPEQIALQVASALGVIARQGVSCTLALPNAASSSPNAATVTLQTSTNEVALRRRNDAASCIGDGWYFDDNLTPTAITLCPTSCTTAQTDATSRVNVSVGCPAQLGQTLYHQTYDGACKAPGETQWSFLAYNTLTPGDSSIRFRARTAETEADLPGATFIELAVAQRSPDTQICNLSGPAPCPIDLYATLGAANARFRFLQLEAVLTPTSDQRVSPVLGDWKVTYSCPPAQ